jgi:hypothetical protein
MLEVSGEQHKLADREARVAAGKLNSTKARIHYPLALIGTVKLTAPVIANLGRE